MPAGPWRAGVAVIVSRAPPALTNCFASQGLSPSATPPRRAGAAHRGEHARGRRRERAAGVVEIVGMLVMTDQHRVDRPDPVGGQSRARGLGQGDVAQLVLAGSVEGGIGDEAESLRFDQDGRPSYEGQGQCRHRVSSSMVPKIGRDHATEHARVASHQRVGSPPTRTALAAPQPAVIRSSQIGNCGAGINVGNPES